ncbi:MAG: hypothetical protein MUC94_08805 [bacterium]|jgi:hypothetical protein|nr:hypothetical protein [bacterium]
MITIKILNANKLVEKEKGRLISKIAPIFVNLEKAVEKRIAEKLMDAFQEKEIEAVIEIVSES